MDTGDVVAIATGAAGVVMSLLSIRVAVNANKRAAEANVIARGANELATGANALSSESNMISRGANELAQEANDISRAEAARAAERHDVRWEGNWFAAGVYRITNVGLNDAVEVHMEITVDDERKIADKDVVNSGNYVDLLFPIAEQNGYADRRKVRTRSVLVDPVHAFHHHITWQTMNGTPKVHDSSYIATLADFD